MAERVRITDVSPRDGLQNEPGVIPSAEKVRLVEMLCATGVDEVEVTSFVSPRWVPQLGDAGVVLDGVRSILERPKPLPEGGVGVGSSAQPPREAKAVERAQELRATMTGPEKKLWAKLGSDQMDGLHFRRQHPFGPFILDFYCHDAGVSVEIDGESHADDAARSHDAKRTGFVESYGVKELRFTNDDVVQNLEGVWNRIREVCGLRRSWRDGTHPKPLPLGGASIPIFSALVPNMKGMESAVSVHDAGMPLKVGLFTAASETFNKKNINATIAESIERFRPVVAEARAHGMAVRVYVSCAVACPFEGPISPGKVVETVALLRGLFEDEDEWRRVDVDIADTIGVAHAHEIEKLLDAFDASARSRMTLHLHDTFGRAGACVVQALSMGVRSFDGSAGGLGGCPYASTSERRAPGNISTELLARVVREAGYETGVDEAALAEAGAYAREIVARANAGIRGGSA